MSGDINYNILETGQKYCIIAISYNYNLLDSAIGLQVAKVRTAKIAVAGIGYKDQIPISSLWM